MLIDVSVLTHLHLTGIDEYLKFFDSLDEIVTVSLMMKALAEVEPCEGTSDIGTHVISKQGKHYLLTAAVAPSGVSTRSSLFFRVTFSTQSCSPRIPSLSL